MKRRSAAVLIPMLLFFSMMTGTAWAGTTYDKIAQILVYEAGDIVYVYPVGGVQNPPGCHGANGNYYSFRMNRPRATEYYAGLLAAFLRGRNVILFGTGGCTDQSVSETLGYFIIQ